MSHFSSRMRRILAVLSVATVLPLAASLLVPAGPAVALSVVAAPLVDARHGDLKVRPAGMPTSGSPARQLARARVTQDLVRDRVRATVVLRGVPTTATNAQLHVEFGWVQDNACQGDMGFTTATASALSPGFTRSGETITFDKAVNEAGYEDWNCAVVALTVPGTTTTYDALIGELTDVLARPRLRISEVRLLRKEPTKVRLVRNVWTVLEVEARNAGRVDATDVTVKGRGKGLRVKGARLGRVHADGTGIARIKVKLTRKRATRLKLIVRGSGARATRKVRVVSRKAPPRPVAGRYRSTDGDITFRIKDAKVVGFRAHTLTTCGGYPDLPTYSYNTYDYPTTRVGRDGIVNARQHRELYSVGLEMMASGKRVTQGYFYYSGPDRCHASERFTAERIGK